MEPMLLGKKGPYKACKCVTRPFHKACKSLDIRPLKGLIRRLIKPSRALKDLIRP